jgi:hypothetical protein
MRGLVVGVEIAELNCQCNLNQSAISNTHNGKNNQNKILVSI